MNEADKYLLYILNLLERRGTQNGKLQTTKQK